MFPQTNHLYVKSDSPIDADSSVIADEYVILSKLNVLAEKLMDDTAKDAVLNAMAARSVERFKDGNLYYPALDSIKIIYEGTPVDSLARKLMVTMYAASATNPFTTDKSEAVPKEFLYDLSLSLLVERPLKKDFDNLEREVTELKKQREVAKEELKSLRQALKAHAAQPVPFDRVQAVQRGFMWNE